MALSKFSMCDHVVGSCIARSSCLLFLDLSIIFHLVSMLLKRCSKENRVKDLPPPPSFPPSPLIHFNSVYAYLYDLAALTLIWIIIFAFEDVHL